MSANPPNPPPPEPPMTAAECAQSYADGCATLAPACSEFVASILDPIAAKLKEGGLL